jgi:hypothetical protein
MRRPPSQVCILPTFGARHWSTPNTRRLVVVPGRAIRRSGSPAPDAGTFPKCCRLEMPIPILQGPSRRSTKSKMRAADFSAWILCTAQVCIDYFTNSSRNGRRAWGAGGCHELRRRRPVTPPVPPSSLSASRISNGDHGGSACVARRRSYRKRSPD